MAFAQNVWRIVNLSKRMMNTAQSVRGKDARIVILIRMKAKITNSLTEYIQKNIARKNAHWALRDGKWFFSIFPGIWMHEESFDDYYPKYEYKANPRSLDNPDSTYVI